MGGGATSVEFRLQTAQNGEYDVYDLSNGAGWGVPVSVTPVGEKCDPISCTPTLSTCPAELQLKDSYGNILGCNSACYGGQGESDQQCCKGEWDGSECVPEMILAYEYFKKPCPHAYAYYQDSRQGSPTVNYLCKAEGDPGFTVTFCPDGEGDSGGLTVGATASSASEKDEKSKSSGTTSTSPTGKIGQPTGTAAASQPSDIPAVSSVSSLNVTSTNAAEATSQAASTDTLIPSSTDSPSPIATESANDSAPSANATSDLPGGVSKTTLVGLGVGAVVVAGLGVIVACVISRRKSKSTVPAAPVSTSTRAAPAGGADSDVEAAAATRRTGATDASSEFGAAAERPLVYATKLTRTSSLQRARTIETATQPQRADDEDLGSLYSDHSASGSERPRTRSSRRRR